MTAAMMNHKITDLGTKTSAASWVFTITITIPSRIDTYSFNTSAAGVQPVTFDIPPNAAPFNGGPATGNLPAIQGTIINASAGDDMIIASVTLSGLTVEVKNGGANVVRAVILTVQGF